MPYYRPSLNEHLAAIEELLSIEAPIPLPFKITRSERVLMELLLLRSILTKEVAWGVLYGHRPDADQPDPNVLSVMIRTLRKRMKTIGVTITTEYGLGWYLRPADKRLLHRVVETAKEAHNG